MKVMKYQPAKPIFKSIFDEFWTGDEWLNGPINKGSNFLPSVNIKENDDHFVIDLMAPGFKKEDFKVTVENEVLTIASETQEENEESHERFTRREFSISTFERTFTLPENVDAENIKAGYQDGILTLTLNKKPETVTKPLQIEVA